MPNVVKKEQYTIQSLDGKRFLANVNNGRISLNCSHSGMGGSGNTVDEAKEMIETLQLFIDTESKPQRSVRPEVSLSDEDVPF